MSALGLGLELAGAGVVAGEQSARRGCNPPCPCPDRQRPGAKHLPSQVRGIALGRKESVPTERRSPASMGL